MTFHIRSFVKEDIDAIVSLSLLAWEPVFISFEQILGPKVFPALYPDWRKIQAEGVTSHCMNTERYITIVAEMDRKVVGFLTYELNHESKTGTVLLLAVHPDYQNGGVGTELNNHSLKMIKTAGMKMVVVEAGGDKSHAPARRSYLKAGYVGLHIVRYFQKI